ncbi:hypothetical protein HPB48_022781 [Haemaphysalis longicornis]|uniref:protein-serine/threonine phosphatase n=1 Tax=Haemaphysalis longicornis TaxID=44386 RepID=A0A9J6GZM2_HAELO|nr:hypothetical protein HPB48_022781 [Haemaphysalis longicornis]
MQLEVRGCHLGKAMRLTREEKHGPLPQVARHLPPQATLVELEAPISISGRIRGQYTDLLRLLEYGGVEPQANCLFLGDDVDRGRQSLETIYPPRRIQDRVRREQSSCSGAAMSARPSMASFRFLDECKRRYKMEFWKTFADCSNWLPIAVVIDAIFCCPGGLSPDLRYTEQIRRIMRPTDIPYISLHV